MKIVFSLLIAAVTFLSAGCTTTLHEAAVYGDVNKVTRLLEQGANPNMKNEKGRTPLHEAAFQGNRAIVDVLIQNGADLNIQEPRYGSTALHIAVYNGFKGVVESLLDAGADIDAIDHEDRTPIYGTTQTGNKYLTLFLLKKGAKINIKEKSFGFTPLHYAVNNQFKDIALILIDHGADINAEDHKGMTPLNQAIDNDDKPMIELLLSKGARAKETQ
jgi:ankyrin repeat protein